jgi:hypothetical protein
VLYRSANIIGKPVKVIMTPIVQCFGRNFRHNLISKLIVSSPRMPSSRSFLKNFRTPWRI